MPEILPSSSDGRSERRTANYQPDRGEERTLTLEGVASDIEAVYNNALFTSATDPTNRLSSISFESRNGRGTYVATSTRSLGWWGSIDSDDGMQELLAIDVIRPIWAAPYWDLNYIEIGEVRRRYEDGELEFGNGWNQHQQQLFGHLVGGWESYYETAYVFRRTYRTSSARLLKAKAQVVNVVVPLPLLSQTMTRLIESLPAGEWLKRPTSVRNADRSGWDVSEEYLWAPKWSIVYGGTFTGLN